MKGRKMQMHEGKTENSDAMGEGKGLRRAFRGFLKRNSLRKLIGAHATDVNTRLTCSSPMAETMVTRSSLPSSKPAEI